MNAVTAALDAPTGPRRQRSRWARLGFAGFLFYLVKGLLWLLLPAALWLGS